MSDDKPKIGGMFGDGYRRRARYRFPREPAIQHDKVMGEPVAMTDGERSFLRSLAKPARFASAYAIDAPLDTVPIFSLTLTDLPAVSLQVAITAQPMRPGASPLFDRKVEIRDRPAVNVFQINIIGIEQNLKQTDDPLNEAGIGVQVEASRGCVPAFLPFTEFFTFRQLIAMGWAIPVKLKRLPL